MGSLLDSVHHRWKGEITPWIWGVKGGYAFLLQFYWPCTQVSKSHTQTHTHKHMLTHAHTAALTICQSWEAACVS